MYFFAGMLMLVGALWTLATLRAALQKGRIGLVRRLPLNRWRYDELWRHGTPVLFWALFVLKGVAAVALVVFGVSLVVADLRQPTAAPESPKQTSAWESPPPGLE